MCLDDAFSIEMWNHGNDTIINDFDVFNDPMFWEENADIFPSGDSGRTNNCEEESTIPQPPIAIHNVTQFPLYEQPPGLPTPFQCSFCHVLREIIHINGNHATKLEIHGRLGIICHGVLEDRLNEDYRMFDFCKQSIEDVKKFLTQYCEERRKGGYVMLQDPLLIFYEALCIGSDCDEDFSIDELLNFSPAHTDENEGEANLQGTEDQTTTKTFLSVQRERAARLTMRDVEKHFNVPIDEAAKRIGVCPTVLKKVCRKNGIHRWPHRKIKSIERKLLIHKSSLNSLDAETRVRSQNEFDKLRSNLNDYQVHGGIR